MESLQDQIDEVLLKSNWKIEESIEELSIDVTENIKKKKSIDKKHSNKHGSNN